MATVVRRLVWIIFVIVTITYWAIGIHATEVKPLVNNTTQYTVTDESDDDSPLETQSAQCTITAGDVKAQAQATISKKLEGICSSKQMNIAFQSMEMRLLQELALLKSLIMLLLPAKYQSQTPQQYFGYAQAAPSYPFWSQPSTTFNRIVNEIPTNHAEQVVPTIQNSSPTPLSTISPSFESAQVLMNDQQPQDDETTEDTQNTVDVDQTIQFKPILFGKKSLEKSVKNDLGTTTTEKIPTLMTSPSSSPKNTNQNRLKIDNFLTSPGLTYRMRTKFTTPITSTIRPTTTITEQTNISQLKPGERVLEFRPVQKKSLLTNRSKSMPIKKTGPRDFEIHKFNNTILTGEEIRIFTYYWKVEHFAGKLKENVTFISSPIFSISGLHLKVKATLNYLNRDYLYLQLESVSNDQIPNNSSIVLETGDMFKEIETKTLFRHKIVILDQATPTSDLISQEFFNTKSGFPIPTSAILSGPYYKDDNILIKIVIFL